MTRKVVEDQIDERYQLEVPAILHDYHQRPMITEIEETRLGELRELIERMGTDINLTAIEEFADVNTRFEFLSSQKTRPRARGGSAAARDRQDQQDQPQAVQRTPSPPSTRRSRRCSRVCSVVARRHCLCRARGRRPARGRCRDHGAAPGKKNSTVEQLSGGEKALTAVALVFSIFLIKPVAVLHPR